MANGNRATALAARIHERDGRASATSGAFPALKTAAARFVQSHAELAAGPSTAAGDGVVLVPLSTPEAALTAILTLASLARPLKTTFCLAVVPADADRSISAGHTPDSLLLAAEQAATLAADGVTDADPRDSRVVVLGPGPDAVTGALIDLILEAYDAMTERQRQIVELVKESETQRQVAGHLDISRQAVNQSLAAAGWRHLEQAEKAARHRLASMPTRADDW